jgi:hypothetical protein
VEKFKDPATLIERSHRLQETLRAEGWIPPAPRTSFPRHA